MAEALKIPKEVVDSDWKKVVDSDWKDDIDFETYGTDKQEMEYISPDRVSKESIEKIKARNEKIGHSILGIFKQEKVSA